MSFTCPSCGQATRSPMALCARCYDPEAGLVRCFAGTAKGFRCRKWSVPGQTFCVVHVRRGYAMWSFWVMARLGQGVARNASLLRDDVERIRIMAAFYERLKEAEMAAPGEAVAGSGK